MTGSLTAISQNNPPASAPKTAIASVDVPWNPIIAVVIAPDMMRAG
jgi:hypothetical protein